MKPGSQLEAKLMTDDTVEIAVPMSADELIKGIPGILRDFYKALEAGELERAETFLGIAECCLTAVDLATSTLELHTTRLTRILPTFDWDDDPQPGVAQIEAERRKRRNP